MAEEKILDKIRKLFAIADKANSNLENASSALQESYKNEALAAAAQANKLLVKYNLSRSQIKLVESEEITLDLPIMGRTCINYDFGVFGKTKSNLWWKELAYIVAPSQFCRVGNGNSNEICFYGFDVDRELTVFTFNKFAEIANNLCKIERSKAKKLAGSTVTDFKTFKTIIHPEWVGNAAFDVAFHYGFRKELEKAYIENREIGNPVINKLNRDVDLYSSAQMRMDRKFQDLIPQNEPDFIYAVQMGEKCGERVSARLEKAAENGNSQALVRNNQLTEVKTVGKVYLAIDDSGSMFGENINRAKKGALDFAYQQTAKGWQIGLLKFGYSATHLIEPQKEVTEKFISELEKMYGSDGSTNMESAIHLAIKSLPKNDLKRQLCIVTDGMPDSQEKTLNAANLAKLDGIEIAAIGIDGCEQEFLDKLVSRKELALLVNNSNFGEGIKRMAKLLTA